MGRRGARWFAIATMAVGLAIGGACQEPEKKGAGAAPGAGARVTDFYSCSKPSDCVVENQMDCCPCNAGGRQVSVRRKTLEAYRAARAERCTGDLLCPQVYLCDDAAAALCLAGKCALGRGSNVRSPVRRPRA